jgi:hypothetical protein
MVTDMMFTNLLMNWAVPKPAVNMRETWELQMIIVATAWDEV